jgi:hypothetical protein
MWIANRKNIAGTDKLKRATPHYGGAVQIHNFSSCEPLKAGSSIQW